MNRSGFFLLTSFLNIMIEVWTSSLRDNDKLIGLGNGKVYKANPKTDEETEALAFDMRKGNFDTTKVWDIPILHCKEIRLQEHKPMIEIFFGREGEEELRITDEYQRHIIFEKIKSISLPQARYSEEKWSIWKTGRKPLIAMGVILLLFLWTLFYAIKAQSGTVYYLADGHYNSLTGIVLAIASLGLVNVISIFSGLLGIAIFAFYRKVKRIPMMHRLLF